MMNGDTSKAKRCILVDGTSYVYRAFFALPPLTSPQGDPTGAVYGVVNMLKRLSKTTPADLCVVVFDPPGPTTRHQLFPDYKANRSAAPDDLHAQMTPTFDLIKAYGWPVVSVPGIEADDVIGTLARQALSLDYEVLISTGDKDFAQLVQPGLTLVNTMQNTQLDVSGVIKKFGVRPDQIIDYLALVGDSADNIPGVEKVGPKTAVKWLDQWNSLNDIMAHADQFPGKVGDNLRNTLTQLPLYQTLVTIDTHIDLPVQIAQCHMSEPDLPALNIQLAALGFKSWLAQLEHMSPPDLSLKTSSNARATSSDASKQVPLNVIDDLTAWQHWARALKQAPAWVLSCQTQNASSWKSDLLGLAMAIPDQSAVYVSFDQTSPAFKDQVLKDLERFLSDSTVCVVGHQFKYDWQVLLAQGLEISAHIEDIELMSYVLNGAETRHDLDTLSAHYLSQDTDVATPMVAVSEDTKDDSAHHVAAAECAWIIAQLYSKLSVAVDALPHARRILTTLDQPLLPILARMEQAGVLLAVSQLKALSVSFAAEIESLETQVHQLAKIEFNLASPKQLRAVLYDQLKLPITKKTPSGEASTSESVLLHLADQGHLLPGLILRHRHLSKLKNTYTDRLPEQVDAHNRVHCVYHQALTATGRLSSQQPNLQNIPIRTAEGLKIRRAFIAPSGYCLLSADYSQVELRIMAHLSKDVGLCRAFEQDLDIHAATAAQLFNCPLDAVIDLQRRQAKTVNFGLIYGMSAFGLASQLKIGRAQAAHMIDAYFEQFPEVQAFMAEIREIAKAQGYVETILGRRIRLPRPQGARQAGAIMRAAINAPMQGSAADLIKSAMIAIQTQLDQQGLDARMILQVHDELVFEVHTSVIEPVKALVASCMEQAMPLSVPLRVNMGVADHWADAHG